jgi:trimeric autotransporter adhesin
LLQIDTDPTAVNLFWATASERNCAYFEIERSRDAATFEAIGKANANGNTSTISNYKAIDNQPFTGVSYYRIKQIDHDGQFSYSNTESAYFRPLHDYFSINPNLIAKGNPIHIQSEKSGYTATANDAWGRELFRQSLSAGSNTITSANLAAGTYFVRISNGVNSCLKKIVVE